MNFRQMQERSAKLCQQALIGTNPQPDWAFRVNDAQSYFSWEAECNMVTTTVQTVSGQQNYQLPAPPMKYFTLAIYGNVSGMYDLIPSTEDELSLINRMWLTYPGGTPTRYWMSDPLTLSLYPLPTNTGDTITLRGIQEYPAMLADTDVTPIPTVYHEGMCLHAAIEELKLLDPDQVEGSRLVRYETERDAKLEDLKAWMGSANSELQRTVRPRALGRTPFGVYTLRQGAR